MNSRVRAKKPRHRLLFKETFVANCTVWEGVNHPVVPWVNKDLDVAKVDVLADGTYEIDGEERHFCDVRVWTVRR